jgi:hypothetical protein
LIMHRGHDICVFETASNEQNELRIEHEGRENGR